MILQAVWLLCVTLHCARSPMSRVVKVLWTASRAQGKKTDRRQITGNDYTGSD